MLKGDGEAAAWVSRYYATEKPGTQALWATQTKTYVFAIASRVEEREDGEKLVTFAVRITWRELLDYRGTSKVSQKPSPEDLREVEVGGEDEAFEVLRRLFREVY